MPPVKWERIMGRKRLREWPSPEYMAGMYECKMQLDMTAMDPEGERAIATMMMQTMAFDPIVAQNPSFMWEIRADYLRAHRREPVEKYIGPKPPVADPKDADEIFTQLEQEQQPEISRADPAVVLPRLMELKQGERFARFTPEAKVGFNDFVRKLKMAYIDNVQKGAELYGQANANQGQVGAGGAPGVKGMGSPGGPGAGAMPMGGQTMGGAAGQPNAAGAQQ